MKTSQRFLHTKAFVPVVNVRRRNPLKGDPTRTATLRRKFLADLNSRFAILKKRLRKLIVEDDAFGLNRLRVNVFCPTGEGGGVDPTCSPTSKTMYRGIGEGADTTSGFEWFSETPKLAQQYADFRGGEVRAVAVSYSKPLNIGNGNEVLSPRSFVAKAIDQADVKSLDKQSVLKSRKEFLSVFGDTSIKVSDYWSTPLFKESTRKLLESFGYDSIKMIEGGEQTVAILRKAATTNQQIENAERFEFQTSAQKVEAFRRWLKQQMELLLVKDDLDIRNDWWDKYIEEGYKQGAGRAFDDTRKPYAKGYAKEGKLSDFYLGSKGEFLRSSFAQPVAREKVKLLAGRVFTDLKGISNSMGTKLVRTLTDGLVQGKNPRAIAKDIDDTVEGIDRSRANAIARTEIIRCHAEGQLDAFENLGVTEVGVAAEWTTAEDEKVCALCSPLEGVVMKVEEARGLLPRHPNCRCAWLPANVGEDQSEQKNTKKEIDEALEESVDLEGGEDKTKWQGADVDVSKRRPESVLNVFCPTGKGGGVDPTCSPGGPRTAAKEFVEDFILSSKLTPNTLDGEARNLLKKTVNDKPIELYRGVGIASHRVTKEELEMIKNLKEGDDAPAFISGRRLALGDARNFSSYTKSVSVAKQYKEGLIEIVLKGTIPQASIIADLTHLDRLGSLFDEDTISYGKRDKEVIVEGTPQLKIHSIRVNL